MTEDNTGKELARAKAFIAAYRSLIGPSKTP
jgi:hypothetical protein